MSDADGGVAGAPTAGAPPTDSNSASVPAQPPVTGTTTTTTVGNHDESATSALVVEMDSAVTVDAQPSVPAPSDKAGGDANENPYGLNAQLAEQDRQEYEAQMREREAPVQPEGDRVRLEELGFTENDVAEGRIVGFQSGRRGMGGAALAADAATAAARWMATPPPGLATEGEIDVYLVLPFSRLNIFCIGINVIIAIVCFASTASRNDLMTLVVGCIAVVMVIALLWMTRSVRVSFDHPKREFRLEVQRIVQACCAPTVSMRAPFESLQGAGFDGAVGVAGELYLDVEHTRVGIGHRIYDTRTQMMSEVMPWRSYIARLQGMSPQDFGVAMMLLQFTNAMVGRDGDIV